MKIKELRLQNIGPYVGQHRIDFSTSNEKNIILIGGQNGAGKTSILKAIKIGLYGCFAYGYKTENMSYMKEVEGILSYYSDVNEYSIRITVEFVEKLEKNEYIILRKWKKQNNTIIESVNVVKDCVALNEADSLEFISKLRAVASPELINSFIFDGETIGNIIDSNKTNSYIRNMFNSVFNIDILNQFREDLTTYLNSEKDRLNASVEFDLTTLLIDINNKKSTLALAQERRNNIHDEVKDIKTRIDSLQNEFIKLGGISKESAIRLRDEVKNLEKASEENNRILREFYEDFLPYCIVLDELKTISERSKEELPIIYASMLEQVQKYMNEDLSYYINKLKSGSEEMLFGLKEDDIKTLDALIKITGEKKSVAATILSGKNNILTNMIHMRETLENNASIVRLNDIIFEIENLLNSLSIANSNEIDIVKHIEDLEREINVMIKKYGEMLEVSKKDRTISKSYLICTNSIAVVDELIEHIKNDKLKALSVTTCEKFNETVRKNDYISEIIIDGDFNLHLYSGTQQYDVAALSAGERQVLVSCIIWAMFKVSGRREMFVFDTPLARLDGETRSLFINKVVANISDQVLILSTDAEFIGANYSLISDRIARTYLLNYNDSTNSTDIEQRYF